MTCFIGLSFSLRHLETHSDDVFRQASASEYPEHFSRLRQGLLSTSMGQTFVTVANNQLTNVMFLWEYDWVFFVVGQYNCFLQPASDTENPLRQHWFQLCESAGTFYFLVGFEVSQLLCETSSLN